MISELSCDIVILLIGIVFPAYCSLVALQTDDKNKGNVLVYWIVFAIYSVVVQICDILFSWFPLYYELKVALLLWIIAPATNGAITIWNAMVYLLHDDHKLKRQPKPNNGILISNETNGNIVTQIKSGVLEVIAQHKMGKEQVNQARDATNSQNMLTDEAGPATDDTGSIISKDT